LPRESLDGLQDRTFAAHALRLFFEPRQSRRGILANPGLHDVAQLPFAIASIAGTAIAFQRQFRGRARITLRKRADNFVAYPAPFAKAGFFEFLQRFPWIALRDTAQNRAEERLPILPARLRFDPGKRGFRFNLRPFAEAGLERLVALISIFQTQAVLDYSSMIAFRPRLQNRPLKIHRFLPVEHFLRGFDRGGFLSRRDAAGKIAQLLPPLIPG
jgi:hypothetical protein